MSNSKALRGLNQIQALTGLSEDAKNGIIQLVNPIMDFGIRPVGYAGTAQQANSIVQVIKRSVTISAPVGVPGNWDFHFFNTPMNVPQFPTAGFQTGNMTTSLVPNSSAAARVGPFVCLSGAAGAQLSMYSAAAAPAAVTTLSVPISPDGPLSSAALVQGAYAGGISQVIGMGLEYHDTTAEISKQGTATVYHLAQDPILDRQSVWVTTATGGTSLAPTNVTLNRITSTHEITDVPSSVSQALLLPGTRQWEAKYGAYVVPTLVDTNIPLTELEPVMPIIKSGTYTDITLPGVGTTVPTEYIAYTDANPGAGVTVGLGTDNVTAAGVSQAIGTTQLQKYNNFNTAGIYVTGLANTATITLNTVMYVQRFPTAGEPTLVVLCGASPKYDKRMSEYYSIITQNLPVGCKVADNADGDWFFEGISTLANFLQPAFMSMKNPIGMGAGALTTLVDKWAVDKLKERNSPKKSKKQKQQMVARKSLPPPPPPVATWNQAPSPGHITAASSNAFNKAMAAGMGPEMAWAMANGSFRKPKKNKKRKGRQ